jgi:outer membrane protein assembly factor BamE
MFVFEKPLNYLKTISMSLIKTLPSNRKCIPTPVRRLNLAGRKARNALLLAGGVLLFSLGACTSAVDNHQRAWANKMFRPYVPDVVQGNFISSEQYAQLKVGMSREQARQIMGTPLLASLFHVNRWDYVFEFKREGEKIAKERRVTLYFEGDSLVRFEGDALPTEVELVAEIDNYAKQKRTFWEVLTGKNKPTAIPMTQPEVLVDSRPSNLPAPTPQPDSSAVVTPVKN